MSAKAFAAKQTELRDRAAKLKVQIDATDRSLTKTPTSPSKHLNFRKTYGQMGYGGFRRKTPNLGNRVFELAS